MAFCRVKRGFLFYMSLISFAFGSDIPKPPMEWREISKQDFQVIPHVADTNASALILCDFGNVEMNSNYDVVYTKHIRIRILNRRGFQWGTHSFILDDSNRGDDLDEIEGVTYTLDASGDIKEYEMDDKDVYQEKIDGSHTRVKFTLPALQPGCIIEYRYTIITSSLLGVRGWTFQCDEPVLWSEYRLLQPATIDFAVVREGYEPFAVEEQYEMQKIFGVSRIQCYLRRWAVQNAPALRDEPYVTNIDDYYNRIKVQPAAFFYSDGRIDRILNTWDNVVEELVDSRELAGRIEVTDRINELASQCTIGKTTSLEKMVAIYNWIASSIVWSGSSRCFAEHSGNDLLDLKKGSNAEINYLLLSMLKAAGIHGDPVLVSTRDHGRLQEVYPIVSQFNYAIARVNLEGRTYFLDATDPHQPYNLLPERVLGVRGLIVQPKKTEWVIVTSPEKSIDVVYASVTIDGNGIIRGSIEGRYENYGNLSVRKALKEKKRTEVAKDLFGLDASGLALDSMDVQQSDSIDSPTLIKVWFSSDSYIQMGGELIYFNPHLVRRWRDNIFKSEKRKFPIDYNYPRKYLLIVDVVLPDTLEIKECLKNKRLTAGSGVIYTRAMTTDSLRIHLTSKLDIVNQVIDPEFYTPVKDLYAAMISTEGEQLILQKKPKPVVVPEPSKAESKKTPEIPKKTKVKR